MVWEKTDWYIVEEIRTFDKFIESLLKKRDAISESFRKNFLVRPHIVMFLFAIMKYQYISMFSSEIITKDYMFKPVIIKIIVTTSWSSSFGYDMSELWWIISTVFSQSYAARYAWYIITISLEVVSSYFFLDCLLFSS